MSAQPKMQYSLEEYFELDRKSDERLELWNGEIFSMSGVSREHATVEMNVSITLGARLRAKSCQLFPANVRIKVPSLPPYRYSDLSALCGKAQFEKIGGVDTLINPSLIIEILSPSTEAYDRGDKFTYYKSIPSFCEYLLIAQHRPHISQFIKQSDGTWLFHEYNSLADTIRLQSLSCEMTLSEIYQDIFFDNPDRI
ncbi:MAG: Uma2 family endonuclease [Acidobacteriota bacterium]|nr:Uma2 family endonuclease [Acidobacteriota bacterium]